MYLLNFRDVSVVDEWYLANINWLKIIHSVIEIITYEVEPEKKDTDSECISTSIPNTFCQLHSSSLLRSVQIVKKKKKCKYGIVKQEVCLVFKKLTLICIKTTILSTRSLKPFGWLTTYDFMETVRRSKKNRKFKGLELRMSQKCLLEGFQR